MMPLSLCIENLLLPLNLFTFRIKLKAPLRQMSDFTLSPPILAAILCNAPPSSFSAPPPDSYCTVPNLEKETSARRIHLILHVVVISGTDLGSLIAVISSTRQKLQQNRWVTLHPWVCNLKCSLCLLALPLSLIHI